MWFPGHEAPVNREASGGSREVPNLLEGGHKVLWGSRPVSGSLQEKGSRIVTILDLEMGIGWTSCSGCFRLTGGYVVSSWLNTVKTADFIRAVQQNNFGGLNGTTTFDGLVARAEVRF